MTRLILVRHGKTSGEKHTYYGWRDIGLSEVGVTQSRQVVEALGKIKPEAVYCSDLSRACVLGEMIAEAKSLQPLIDERLRELNFGEWEGRPSEELFEDEMFQKWLKNIAREKIPGGERMGQLLARVTDFLREVREKYQNKTVIIVSHYGTLKTILLHILKMELKDFWTFHLDLASISIVEYDETRPRIVQLNDLCHLGGLHAHLD